MHTVGHNGNCIMTMTYSTPALRLLFLQARLHIPDSLKKLSVTRDIYVVSLRREFCNKIAVIAVISSTEAVFVSLEIAKFPVKFFVRREIKWRQGRSTLRCQPRTLARNDFA